MFKQIYCSEGTTCHFRPLEERKIIKRAIHQGIWRLILFGFIVGIFFRIFVSSKGVGYPIEYFYSYVGMLLILLLIILVYNTVYNILYFRFYFYDLKEDRIIIRKGVISRREITIYYNKIQNVFVDQDFWDRIFKLYDVHIATADQQSMLMAHIDGVSKENAEALKNSLLEKIKKSGVDTSI